ncbi:MAG: hypothetical protein AB1634_09865 [Thermodesulfobacteriota bacterium]
MVRVGIVAEGKSDWLALESFLEALHPDIQFERLRPDLTLLSRSPHGWRGVKAWCQEHGPRLETLMQGVIGRPLHLLLVHLDCSMAHNEGARRPCPPAADTADALREVVLGWLARHPQPSCLLIVTPSMQTDTWVVAALTPPYRGDAPLECDMEVERELVRRRLLRRKDGEVKKPEAQFRPLVKQMAAQLDEVCGRCPQAKRLHTEFTAAVALLGG